MIVAHQVIEAVNNCLLGKLTRQQIDQAVELFDSNAVTKAMIDR